MGHRLILAGSITAVLFASAVMADDGPAAPDQKYVLKENVQKGDSNEYYFNIHTQTTRTDTANGVATPDNEDSRQQGTATMDILAVQDGSAVRAKVTFADDCVDSSNDNGTTTTHKASLAGRPVVIQRQPDESVADDLADHDKLDPADISNLDMFLNPDESIYPDHAVAVGDIWDPSAKMLKYSGLAANDQFSARVRLDWVKTINGRQVAHVSISSAVIEHLDGNAVEEDQNMGSCLIDVAKSQVIWSKQWTKISYSSPKTAPVQVTGGGEQDMICCIAEDKSLGGPTTQP